MRVCILIPFVRQSAYFARTLRQVFDLVSVWHFSRPHQLVSSSRISARRLALACPMPNDQARRQVC